MKLSKEYFLNVKKINLYTQGLLELKLVPVKERLPFAIATHERIRNALEAMEDEVKGLVSELPDKRA